MIDPSAKIHPMSVVEEGAVIGPDCEIGPFCLVGSEVTLGARSILHSHVVVKGKTTVGVEAQFFAGAVIGEIPQDKKFKGEKTSLEIGDRVRIRESATVNLGTDGGGGVTRIGDDCLLMSCCHIAHDVQMGKRVIVVSSSAIAGHCELDDDVIIGGLSGVHQFVRIGRGAIIGGMTKVTNDVIPYGLVQASRGELDGLNLVGLKRKGVERSDIMALRAAYQALAQGEGTFQERAQRLADDSDSEYVREIAEFILTNSSRSFLTPG